MHNALHFLMLAIGMASIAVLVLFFQMWRDRSPARLRLLSKLLCGLAVAWVVAILLGDKPVWLDIFNCLLNGWLSYSFKRDAIRIEALLEAAKRKAQEEGEREGGQDDQPPGS